MEKGSWVRPVGCSACHTVPTHVALSLCVLSLKLACMQSASGGRLLVVQTGRHLPLVLYGMRVFFDDWPKFLDIGAEEAQE